jgi:hypothetical protein
MIILIISIIISLILIYEMLRISNEIDEKNEIISYLKKEVIQNIKNNLELNDKKYVILNLNNKLKKEIESKNKLKRLFTRNEMISKSKSEIFKKSKYKYPCKLKRCYSI